MTIYNNQSGDTQAVRAFLKPQPKEVTKKLPEQSKEVNLSVRGQVPTTSKKK